MIHPDGTVQYEGVLDIPAQQMCGSRDVQYAIVKEFYPAGHEFRRATTRTALVGGHRGSPVVYDRPTVFHRLTAPEGTWMSDIPIEQAEHDELVKDGFDSGSILIGGLGLGYITTVLAMRPGVNRIVVVEKSPEIVSLVWPHVLKDKNERNKVVMVTGDLFEYLREYPQMTHAVPFHWAFYDIWQLDTEAVLFDTVNPLLQLSQDIVINRPACWRETVMRGQLFNSLLSRVFMLSVPDPHGRSKETRLELLSTPTEDVWVQWSVPFFLWYKGTQLGDQSPVLHNAMGFYAGMYGQPFWEAAWSKYTMDLDQE